MTRTRYPALMHKLNNAPETTDRVRMAALTVPRRSMAINTADSMIGHRSPRHEDFGRFAARLDDWVNWLPARLTGLIFAAVSPRPSEAITIMRRDAKQHRSPNAGWPEAAMAAALDCRLSGPRVYQDRVAEEPWLNPDSPDPLAADLRRALALYRRAMWVVAAALAVIALLIWI